MSVSIDVNGELFTVPYDKAKASEYIKEYLDHTSLDQVVYVPEKYYDIAYNYIFFLQDIKPLPIYDRDMLKACFDMYTYFFDDNYFDFLIQQLLNNWSYLFTVVFGTTNSSSTEFQSEQVNPNLQRQILLSCPYDFLPNFYLEDKLFFKQWRKANVGKVIVVNQLTSYKFTIDSSDHDNNKIFYVSSQHLDGDIIGRKKLISINKEDFILSEYTIFNGKVSGISKRWDNTGYNLLEQIERHDDLNDGLTKRWYPITIKTGGKHQLESRGLYDNGRKIGVWTTWYENGHIKSEFTYDGHQLHGPYKIWYNYGILSKTGNYEHGEKHGDTTFYYQNGNISSEGKYVNDKRDGIWKSWYGSNNGKQQLREEAEYNKGQQHGIENTWYPDGTPKSQGIYVRGKKQGMWTFWTDNDVTDNNILSKYPQHHQHNNTIPTMIRETGMIQHGTLKGVWKFYYDDDIVPFKEVDYS